ncbi:hypothetical protein DQ04_12401000 [Trypanosoma grayi]|uniref:hypothetical protein n=1 Tax=Trypanosoma grayi TaxID=71804 RepID=UPI0004F42C0D|nr:hypothetical protein DQ04_12401000 [Trypanosoma grayi]KEG06756.1 hypothetical protein DQ04_12401000 [Trypanosoma grayi]
MSLLSTVEAKVTQVWDSVQRRRCLSSNESNIQQHCTSLSNHKVPCVFLLYPLRCTRHMRRIQRPNISVKTEAFWLPKHGVRAHAVRLAGHSARQQSRPGRISADNCAPQDASMKTTSPIHTKNEQIYPWAVQKETP